MSRTRRGLRLPLAAAIVALLTSACGSSSSSPGATGSASGATSASASGSTASSTASTGASGTSTAAATSGSSSAKVSGKKVTITWWHIQTTNPLKTAFATIAADYEKLHPNVSIEITPLANEDFKAKLATAMQAGSPPDIFHSWGGQILDQYGQAGLTKDLTGDLKGAWGASFSPASLGMTSTGGKNYAAPWQLSGVGIWYNKALFQKAGITAVPSTWDEFMAAVAKLKAAGITPIALGDKEQWEGMYWYQYLAMREAGQQILQSALSGKTSFDSAPFINAGTLLKSLISAGGFPNGYQGMDYTAEEALMGSGKAAMELQGDWSPSLQMADDPAGKGLGDNLGFMPFPTVTGGVGSIKDMMAGVGGYALGKNAPPEAVDFLKYFTSRENETTFASQGYFLTTVKGTAAAVKDPNLKTVSSLLAAAPYLQNFIDQSVPQAAAIPLVSAITGIFAGSSTPEQAAKGIQSAVQSAH